MNKITIALFCVFLTCYNCGSKATKSSGDIIKERDNYITEVKSQNLNTSVSEGALTDTSGFKDIGTFKLSYYFGANNNLQRIENIETTDKIVTENYYFEDNNLVYISSKSDNEVSKKVYLFKGNVVNDSNLNSEHRKILLDKAKMFQKESKKLKKVD